jgi:hypothetical protein
MGQATARTDGHTSPPAIVATNRDGYFRVDRDTTDYGSVVPRRVAYHASGLPADANLGVEGNTPRRLTSWLSIEARNASGGLILHEDLNVEVLYENGLASGNVEGLRLPDWDIRNGPELAPGQVRRFSVALQRIKDDTLQGSRTDHVNAPLYVISIPASYPPISADDPGVRTRAH